MSEIVHKYSAGGVIINGGKILVISSALRNSVGLPKGKLDEGESPELAAIREVKEETGYDVEIIEKLDDYTFEHDWTDGKPRVKTVTYYLMRLLNDLPPQPNLQEGEDFEVKWVSADEALELLTYDDSKDAVRLAVKRSELVSK